MKSKNPLTPIQLLVDSLKNKYSDLIDSTNQYDFNEKIKTINRQIKLIEKLVNEFSDFARMPKPIFKKNNISKIIKDVIKLMKQNNDGVIITFDEKKNNFLSFDQEQMNRVFINIFKNAIESLKEKYEKVGDFSKKIDIEISSINDYINIVIDDNGIGFDKENLTIYQNPILLQKRKALV